MSTTVQIRADEWATWDETTIVVRDSQDRVLREAPRTDALVAGVENLAATYADDVAEAENAEACRVTMRDLTDVVIDWCENAEAFIGSSGVHGAVAIHGFNGYLHLLQQAQAVFLDYKELPVAAITQRLERQHKDLELRCQNATAFVGVAALA